MSGDIQWFAGIDWASEIHQVVLVDARGTITGEHTFPHGGEGLGALCDWLLTATGAPPEAIASPSSAPPYWTAASAHQWISLWEPDRPGFFHSRPGFKSLKRSTLGRAGIQLLRSRLPPCPEV
jgi:hypothetical protein